MLNPNIRPESPSDAFVIYAVTEAAFLNAAHTEHTEQFVVDALRKANALTISLVAEFEGAIIGHVAISPVVISDGSPNWYGLGPISVSPNHQGRGIGSSLIRESLRRLKEIDGGGCVVLGDPRYYSRFGFKPESNMVYPGVPQEYFQTLSFSTVLPHGVVTYHQAFAARD